MKGTGKGEEGEPGPGGTDRPVPSPKVPAGPCSPRSVGSCPGSFRGRRCAPAAAHPPRGLRVHARDLRPPPLLPRSHAVSRLGGRSPPAPAMPPQKGRGRRKPGGIWAGSPEGAAGARPEGGEKPSRYPGPRVPAPPQAEPRRARGGHGSAAPSGRGWGFREELWSGAEGQGPLRIEREGRAALWPGRTLLQRVTFLHGPRPRAQTRQRLK